MWNHETISSKSDIVVLDYGCPTKSNTELLQFFFFLVVLAYMQFMLQSNGLKLNEKGAPIVKCFSGMLPAQLSVSLMRLWEG